MFVQLCQLSSLVRPVTLNLLEEVVATGGYRVCRFVGGPKMDSVFPLSVPSKPQKKGVNRKTYMYIYIYIYIVVYIHIYVYVMFVSINLPKLTAEHLSH